MINGSEQVKHDLQAALGHRFPQTVLLTGASPSVLSSAAQVLAAGLLCKCVDQKPCGVCSACKKVEGVTYADLSVIDEGEGELKVDLARKIKADTILVPTEGDRRVTIIHHADKLNISAQNALLKEIEEPPVYAFFILTADKPDALLQTVRSRCTKFQFAPHTEDVAPDDTLLTHAKRYLSAIASRYEDQMMLAAVAAEKLTRAQMQDFCALLKCAMRDAVFFASGLSCAPLLPALTSETQALAANVTPNRLIAASDFFSVLSERLSRNASAAAMTCALTAELYKIFYL